MSEHTAEQALTHHVALILDNDEPLYRHRLALVAEAREQARVRFQSREACARHILADSLKDWCEELAGLGEVDHGLASEVLTTALAFVDWREMATDYLAEED